MVTFKTKHFILIMQNKQIFYELIQRKDFILCVSKNSKFRMLSLSNI
jgi:hypothetical protein